MVTGPQGAPGQILAFFAAAFCLVISLHFLWFPALMEKNSGLMKEKEKKLWESLRNASIFFWKRVPLGAPPQALSSHPNPKIRFTTPKGIVPAGSSQCKTDNNSIYGTLLLTADKNIHDCSAPKLCTLPAVSFCHSNSQKQVINFRQYPQGGKSFNIKRI